MNRWYFSFLVGILVFLGLFFIGKQELSFILLYSFGTFMGFFGMYLLNRRRENK
ncbi:hypothetical protein [Rossellomorea aquimaris]|uniref:hypothetical protein n=1 Tax=Rossellomorea aquimaris TaxID=189382 RepID=UPI000AA154CF|nr:hypothetical protein [Rossellomorea aquimaris]